MDSFVAVVALVVGIPVVGGTLVGMTALIFHWWKKAREMKIQEKRLEMEERLKSDDLNARILRMDELGFSPQEIASLADEVRRLREEVSQIRQQIDTRNL